MGYTRTQVNVGADTSNVTGSPWFIGDFIDLTISIQSGSAFASRLTVLGTNLDGFQSTLSSGGGLGNSTVPAGGWSIVTAITSEGLYVLDPGFRWINTVRPTATSGQTASNITVIFAGKT